MSTRICIVHYAGYESYTKLKCISAVNESKIREANALRYQVGGENHHKQQCDLVPEVIDHFKHGIHLEPCYKKYTLIVSQRSKDTTSPPDVRASLRLSSPTSSNPRIMLYPKECTICKRYLRKVNQKQQKPKQLLTFVAQETIKAAAKVHDPAMYAEIHDLNLIAKEFKYHDKCYREFTHGFSFSYREGSIPS